MARTSALAAVPVPTLPLELPPPKRGHVLPTSMVGMFLNSGGDERLTLDPISRRTRYGTRPVPAEGEIWFSSATASSIDPRSFAAVSARLAQLVGPQGTFEPRAEADIGSSFDGLRRRLVRLFGIPGTEAVLCGSGTEAEFLALSLAQTILPRPLTNIVMAPEETGSGVMLAAAGRHFLSSSCLGGAVTRGILVRGLDRRGIETRGIAIRDEAGYPRDPAAIDREAAQLVAQALAAGRDVVLHLLDASKTGLSGVTRDTARALAAQARGRIAIVVDACQLRCPPARLWEDLGAGFIVMITGSKFAGGPPFSGSLLLPPAMVERLGGKGRAPSGLSAYSARFDWPAPLRENFAANLDQLANFGLGLRWEAALALIEPYFALPESLRAQILGWFAGAVHRLIAARPHLRQIAGEPSRHKTIIPVETAGEAASLSGATKLYAALAMPHAPAFAAQAPARACHVGQPVALAEKAVLRICSSMPMVLDIAARIKSGQKIETAIAPVLDDLGVLFEKWDLLAGA